MTVVEVDAGAFPPVPDPAALDQWRLGTRRVGAAALGSPPAEVRAVGSQYVVLHIQSRRLAFHAADWRASAPTAGACTRREWEAYFGPGSCFRPGVEQWSQPVPGTVRWGIDSGVAERPYLTAGQAQAFLEALIELAECLVDHLLPVAGTSELDWSAQSASAGLDIQLACRRDEQPAQGRRPFLIGMEEAVVAWPALVRPHWAGLVPGALAAEADAVTRFGIAQHPQLQKVFARHARHGSLQIVGARAWMFANHAGTAAPVAGTPTPDPTHSRPGT